MLRRYRQSLPEIIYYQQNYGRKSPLTLDPTFINHQSSHIVVTFVRFENRVPMALILKRTLKTLKLLFFSTTPLCWSVIRLSRKHLELIRRFL